MDLESGEMKMEVQNSDNEKTNDIEILERECRICHMSLMESCCGVAIELKCDCKGDLAAAHQHCADTWFKIRGNRLLLYLESNFALVQYYIFIKLVAKFQMLVANDILCFV